MLVLKLVEITDKKVVYNYHPAGDSECGVLLVDKDAGDVNIVKVAENDEHKIYLSHALRELKRLYEKSNYPKERLVAWY